MALDKVGVEKVVAIQEKLNHRLFIKAVLLIDRTGAPWRYVSGDLVN